MKFYFFNTDLSSEWYASSFPDELLPREFTLALPVDTKISKLSFILIKNQADKHSYIGKIYNIRKVTTFNYSITVREVNRLYVLDLDELIVSTHGLEVAEKILHSKYPVELNKSSFNEIRDRILETNDQVIGDNYFNFDRLVGGQYIDVVPQAIDSISMSLKLFGFDPRDIPPLREEQILDFEIDSFFPNKVAKTPDGKHYFDHAGKRLYIHKVHNTTIERCLGVDLIYNFLDDQRILFIQYKCLSDKNDKKFYKSSDQHFPKELERMKNIPGVSNCYNFAENERKNLRICNCPVYIKLCARQIRGNRVTPYGFYYPICIWENIYSSSEEKYITLNDEPRITNGQFVDFVKSGLFGSTPKQSVSISSHLVNQAKDDRLKLVFSEQKL